MVYERFGIKTYEAPSKYLKKSESCPFNPTANRIELLKMIASEVVHLNKGLFRKEGLDFLLSRPCIYGVFSRPVGGFWPVKEKCTGCMRCVQEFPKIMRVERNEGFFDFGDSYWVNNNHLTQTNRSTILYEAETGKIRIRGMGYQGPFSGEGWDSLWTDMSEIVRPTRDGVHGREFISTEVNLGRKKQYIDFDNNGHVTQPQTIDSPLPILFNYLPKEMTNDSIRRSVEMAAEEVGTFFFEKLDLTPKYESNDRLIPIVDDDALLEELSGSFKAVELSNVSYDFTLPNLRIPVFAGLKFEDGFEKRAIELARKGFSGLHVYADYHGREFDSENPRFIKDGLISLHNLLVEEKLRSEISIIASGGVILAEHVPKAILCGADAIAIDTSVPVALEYRFKGECRNPESSRINKRKLDEDWGRKRLVNLLGSWHSQLIEIMSAMGVREVRRLPGEAGRLIFNDYLSEEWL